MAKILDTRAGGTGLDLSDDTGFLRVAGGSASVVDYASQAEAEAGTNNTKLMTPLRSTQTPGGSSRASSYFTGNGSQTSFTLTHNLGSKYVSLSFWLTNTSVTDEPVLVDWQPTNTTTAVVTFPNSRPLSSGWRIDWLAIG